MLQRSFLASFWSARMAAADNGGRVGKELAECQRDTSSGITVVQLEALRHLEGTIKGPDGTPYDGGVFKVCMRDKSNVCRPGFSCAYIGPSCFRLASNARWTS